MLITCRHCKDKKLSHTNANISQCRAYYYNITQSQDKQHSRSNNSPLSEQIPGVLLYSWTFPFPDFNNTDSYQNQYCPCTLYKVCNLSRLESLYALDFDPMCSTQSKDWSSNTKCNEKSAMKNGLEDLENKNGTYGKERILSVHGKSRNVLPSNQKIIIGKDKIQPFGLTQPLANIK